MMEEEDMGRYLDLERDIADLKEFAKPLDEEARVSPIYASVTQIMDLPENLDKFSAKEVARLEGEVAEAKRALEEGIAYEYVQRTITKPDPSQVFKILAKANKFEGNLKKAIGKTLTLEDGTELQITPEIYRCITRYRFSIGTPPITPDGIETLEKMLFGGSLKDVYGFRNILGKDQILYDRLISRLDQLVEQSTHYTTANEKKKFEKEARDTMNMEGLTGFTKTIVSGTADTAIRLINDELLSQHSNGSRPVEIVKGIDQIDDRLIEKMSQDQEKLFVVRVSKVENDIFSTERLHPKWRGIIGRLIIVEDSEKSRKSGTTLVYSIHPGITSTLNKLHIKDSGTQANTQMNLRKILEDFKMTELDELIDGVEEKMKKLEEEGICNRWPEDVRKEEWTLTAQKDYLSLKKFKKVLETIRRIKTGSKEDLEELNKKLMEDSENYAMDYFFKALKGKGYDCISIPQGGGRRELGIIGKFELSKHKKSVEEFQKSGLEEAKAMLAEAKEKNKIDKKTTDTEKNALERSLLNMQSPNHAIREMKDPGYRSTQYAEAGLEDGIHGLAEKIGKALRRGEDIIDTITTANISGELRTKIASRLKDLGIASASKRMERGNFRKLGNLFRELMGKAKKLTGEAADSIEDIQRKIQRGLETRSLEFASQLINDIENGTFHPSLAMSEVGWTFNDVLDEDYFPKKNYINIGMDENGQLNPDSLEEHMEDIEEKLYLFPDLFKLYCSSIILIFNDPHNPTSTVASNEVKLKLLDIASKYDLTIIADEAYRKQVSKNTKEKQGDWSLAEFYESNKGRFPNPITIHTSLPTTKWALGAGRRTGVILTNNKSINEDGLTLREFAEEIRDGANTMSLHMDNESYKTGLMVKKVCKALEYGTVMENPAPIIDNLLSENFADIRSEEFVPAIYSALIEARNDLDRLRIRAASPLDYRQYCSNFISELKDLRLDKRTQRDSAKRSKAAIKAVERVSKDHPEIAASSIKPDGPFYFCVQLDSNGADPGLSAFLEKLAEARGIDLVPRAKGYVRFAFGGMVDGTNEGYQLLSEAIETDLRILIKYWREFKEKRAELNKAEDLDPQTNALRTIFPGGEIEFVRTYQEKRELIEKQMKTKEKLKSQLTFQIPANVDKYISKIEANSPAHIVTLRNLNCQTTEEFISSRIFKDLFNHYLLKIKSSVSEIQHLSDEDTIAFYGARKIGKKFDSRDFKNNEREIYAKIIIEIANEWFSQNTIKILAENYQGKSAKLEKNSLKGIEATINEHIDSILKAFLSEEQEKQVKVMRSFQAGYQSINNLEANKNLPGWTQKLIKQSEFVAESVATDPCPEMKTSASTRVAGHDRGIYKRDGDGESAPKSEYFSKRLNEFVENMDPNKYVCKMIQAGPVRVMLVMDRAYSHYLVEELRLFPQFEILDGDISNMKPDAISFLGIPQKVMGEDYKIGYFIDECEDGTKLPVSWVDKEDITDYMGYLKKPILTVANEKVKEMGGIPIHGSAITITFKNGLRKTVVLAGDSGTGKSETIIAMMEQIIKQEGSARDVESVELLAGDMLSLFVGSDGQVYMFGTEEGDFMRMTDISEGWQERYRDLLAKGSKTNLDHPTNPRITVSGLCDKETFLLPVRVNMFYGINNFEPPKSEGPLSETENQENFLLNEYVRGYRGEKGTSGDQPNLYASVLFSDSKDKERLLREYGEDLDKFIAWDCILDERGKPKNANLQFTDIEGGVFKALRIIKDLFLDKELNIDGERRKVIDIKYLPQQNNYHAKLDNGEERILDRETFFKELYNPIASTYGGDPFVHPSEMYERLSFLAKAMNESGVITGTIYTQLKRKGQEFAGPAAAAQALFKFCLIDPRINQRFTKHKNKVNKAMTDKYGDKILAKEGPKPSLPTQIEALNLYLLERHSSDTIRFVNDKAETINIETPYYKYDPEAKEAEFNPRLITPEIEAAIKDICENEEYNRINLDTFRPDLTPYLEKIQAWDSIEELMYQIMIVNGAQLGYPAHEFERSWQSVKKAEKIANLFLIQKKFDESKRRKNQAA